MWVYHWILGTDGCYIYISSVFRLPGFRLVQRILQGRILEAYLYQRLVRGQYRQNCRTLTEDDYVTLRGKLVLAAQLTFTCRNLGMGALIWLRTRPSTTKLTICVHPVFSSRTYHISPNESSGYFQGWGCNATRPYVETICLQANFFWLSKTCSLPVTAQSSIPPALRCLNMSVPSVS